MISKVIKKEWKKVRLDECFDIQQGKQVSEKNRIGDNQRPFLRTSNVFWGKLDLSKLDKMNFTEDEEKKFTLKKGDLLLCEGGDIGRTAIWSNEIENCYYQNHLHRLRKKIDEVDENFVFFYLKYAFIYAKLYIGRGNITTIPNISKSRLSELEISLPSFSKQQEISHTLMSVQDAIEKYEELAVKLKNLKGGMMQNLFTCGTKGEKTRITEIGEIPESWDLVNLDSVCEKPTYGFTDSASKKGNVKFLRITDIKEDGVDWSSVPFCNCPNPEKYLLKDGDIVFARIGATTGKSYLIKNPDNAVYASYLIRVRVRDMQSGFLQNYFQTEAYWKQIDAQKGTSLKGGVNGSILSKLRVPLCTKEEQIKIVETIDTIDNKILLAQKKLEIYQNLFKTLLHELMSGGRSINIK